jgi:selenocysteine lyase/cysteine desulfurase
LDTARLGQMTPAAKDAQLDFVRLSAEEPSSLYFEKFLRDGFSDWPSSYQQRFPGLGTWKGVSGLKRCIKRLVHAPQSWQVLLASRSLSLVRLASSCMLRVCRNILATDLSWPTYQQAIETRASVTGNRVTTVEIRDEILDAKWTVEDVASYLARAYAQHHCDGLFLPAVDHLGIRVPIAEIVGRIRQQGQLRFCLIDAAQAFCHVPLGDCVELADFIVAGSHKWMGAYLPTGIGLFGRAWSRDLIRNRLESLRRTGRIADPLLHFTEQLDGGTLDGHSETANLAGLFAEQGAAADAEADGNQSDLSQMTYMREQLARLAADVGWRPVQPREEFRSAILLLDSPHAAAQSDPDELRRVMLEANVVVSSYRGGRLRMSVPRIIAEEHWSMLHDALASCH